LTTELLHRFILDLKPGDPRETDHIDGNGLHNCRSNLRVVTHGENAQNRLDVGGTSRFRGVSWHKRRKKWQAHIQVDGRLKHLGYFISEEDAGRVAAQARARIYTHANESRHPVSIGADHARAA
jgi:hypothetical protein